MNQFKLLMISLKEQPNLESLIQSSKDNDQFLIWQNKSNDYIKLFIIGRPNGEKIEDTFFFQSILKFQISPRDILNERPENKRRIRTIRGCLNAFFYSEDKVPSTLVLRPNNDYIMQTKQLLGKNSENVNEQIFNFINKTFFKIETDKPSLGNTNKPDQKLEQRLEDLENRIQKLENYFDLKTKLKKDPKETSQLL